MKLLKLKLVHALIPLGVIFIYLIFTDRGKSDMQLQLTILAIVSYFGISIVHHYFDKSLTFEIVFEYILMASLILILVISLI